MCEDRMDPKVIDHNKTQVILLHGPKGDQYNSQGLIFLGTSIKLFNLDGPVGEYELGVRN